MNAPKGKGRAQFIGIVAVFLVPLLLAFWLYYGGAEMQPEGRSNHGVLLEPIVNVSERLPGSALLDEVGEAWLLVHQAMDGCAETCLEALYTQRQTRLMLGKEMDRVTRVFLHGETPPATLLASEEHAGLVAFFDANLSLLLENKRPAEVAPGGYYLIDPLGNLVLYFAPDVNPREMVDDIKHLLRLSHIG